MRDNLIATIAIVVGIIAIGIVRRQARARMEQEQVASEAERAVWLIHQQMRRAFEQMLEVSRQARGDR